VCQLAWRGKLEDIKKAVTDGYASAVAAASMFVYHGARNAVLVNYPTQEQLEWLFEF